jgi:hypothetical protein
LQGIGAALVNAYRVGATALSMEPLSGDDVMVVSPSKSEAEVADLIHQGTVTEGPLSIVCGGTLGVSPNGRKGANLVIRRGGI